MKTLTASAARADLYNLINQIEQNQPVQITGKSGNAVLIAEEDWHAIQESLHLMSIPSVRDSLMQPVDESDLVDEADVDL